ncbi:MAG: exosortase-associated EpsI family protein [Candidatus Rokuibacteriota bacterium]
MSRQLIVLLTLVAVTGGALALGPRERAEAPPVRLDRLPAFLGGWIAVNGASEDILPIDPRAVQSIRRTYTRNGHAVLLSVARYPSWNHPDHRPLFDLIAPLHGAGEVAYETLPVHVNGVPGRSAVAGPVNVLSLKRRSRPLAVAYWYQLDNEPITDEYGLRLRLFADTLRNRPRVFALVRLAAEQRVDLADFLQAFYPRLRDLLVS